jgi:glycosyltransferase involved in cell wall biosynthesis
VKERIRVLHVIQNLNYGGMERLLADLVRRIDSDRFESEVLCLRYHGVFSEGLADYARLHLAPPMERLSMLRPRRLADQIRAIAPDVVHTHSGVWYKVSLAARMAGVPRLVHTEHGRAHPDPWRSKLVDGLAGRRTDVVVAVSQRLAGQLAESVVRVPERIQVIRNGVNTELHRPRPDTGRLRAELGLPADTPIIGSIGRLQPVKGYDVMVNAFRRLRDEWEGHDAPVLVMAGDGRERDPLARRIHDLGLSGSAFLLGWRTDVADLHSAFSVFTMSSRSEGTSVSLLEAMAAGLCPIVTDVGGNGDVLGGDLAHRLVPSEDADALANAWRRALCEPGTTARDAGIARQRVRDEFALERMVAAYEHVYCDEPPAPVSGLELRSGPCATAGGNCYSHLPPIAS